MHTAVTVLFQGTADGGSAGRVWGQDEGPVKNGVNVYMLYCDRSNMCTVCVLLCFQMPWNIRDHHFSKTKAAVREVHFNMP